MSDERRTLRERAEEYKISRWSVCNWYGTWEVCDPRLTEWVPGVDKEFETFAEAIEYAQRQART